MSPPDIEERVEGGIAGGEAEYQNRLKEDAIRRRRRKTREAGRVTVIASSVEMEFWCGTICIGMDMRQRLAR
jgi:hypothetical protein